VSGDLLKGRGQQDQYEASLVYQKRVAEVYRQLAENRPDWKIVKCVRGDQLRNRNEIHEEVMALAEPFLKVV
ncbi:MAG: hypothetical protein M1153_00240, partial [Patescibacteria group bacterium]|nr:hypothetical protein [Patescibacteria group bacterium]